MSIEVIFEVKILHLCLMASGIVKRQNAKSEGIYTANKKNKNY